MPQAGLGGLYFHTDLIEMAAAVLFHIVKNHPFVDGNQRVGAMAAYAFLELNGKTFDAPEKEYGDLVLAIARGKMTKCALAEFFRKHAE
jgi:death-on-curing protein